MFTISRSFIPKLQLVAITVCSLSFQKCSWGEFWNVEKRPISGATTSTIINWPDTGLTDCYDNSVIIACTGTGGAYPQQDADNIDVPAARLYNGPSAGSQYPADYTTRDITTGFVWKTCAEGKSGITCATGTTGNFTWVAAETQCSSLNSANNGQGYAGLRNWRLPVIAELETITNLGTSTPAISQNAFPGTDIGGYWSATTSVADAANAWRVDFNEGSSHTAAKTSGSPVRCIAGDLPNHQPVFTDLGDGTVRENRTNLIWAKCSNGFSFSGGTCSGSNSTVTWDNALIYCNSFSLAGRQWRLPSANEYLSISDKTLSGLVIPATFFPNANTTPHWSSTTTGTNAGSAFTFDPGAGLIAASNKGTGYQARCVSTGP